MITFQSSDPELVRHYERRFRPLIDSATSISMDTLYRKMVAEACRQRHFLYEVRDGRRYLHCDPEGRVALRIPEVVVT